MEPDCSTHPDFKRRSVAACDLGPVLIIIEAAADVFAGNEIVRSEVRQFMALMRKLAIKSGAAVLLLQHPSLTGLKEGTGTSGTTHWRNSARTFLNFTAPDREDLRELRVTKNNYGPTGEVVQCRWQNGVFVPLGVGNPLERAAAVTAVRRVPFDWVRGIAILKVRPRPLGIPPHRWQIFIEDCRRFLASPWAEHAANLGWDASSLFGSRFQPPHVHLGSSGLLWNLAGGEILRLYKDGATIKAENEQRTFQRRPGWMTLSLPWD